MGTAHFCASLQCGLVLNADMSFPYDVCYQSYKFLFVTSNVPQLRSSVVADTKTLFDLRLTVYRR